MKKDFGLNIDEDTFCKLTLKEQNLVLFRNLKNTKRIHEIVQYLWLTIGTAYLGLFRTVI